MALAVSYDDVPSTTLSGREERILTLFDIPHASFIALAESNAPSDEALYSHVSRLFFDHKLDDHKLLTSLEKRIEAIIAATGLTRHDVFLASLRNPNILKSSSAIANIRLLGWAKDQGLLKEGGPVLTSLSIGCTTVSYSSPRNAAVLANCTTLILKHAVLRQAMALMKTGHGGMKSVDSAASFIRRDPGVLTSPGVTAALASMPDFTVEPETVLSPADQPWHTLLQGQRGYQHHFTANGRTMRVEPSPAALVQELVFTGRLSSNTCAQLLAKGDTNFSVFLYQSRKAIEALFTEQGLTVTRLPSEPNNPFNGHNHTVFLLGPDGRPHGGMAGLFRSVGKLIY